MQLRVTNIHYGGDAVLGAAPSFSGSGDLSANAIASTTTTATLTGEGTANTVSGTGAAVVAQFGGSGQLASIGDAEEAAPTGLNAPTFGGALKANPRASDLNLISGDPIVTLTDHASGGEWTQATESKRPIYQAAGINGFPAMQFNGTSHNLVAGSWAGPITNNAPGATMIVVLQSSLSATSSRAIVFVSTATASAARMSIARINSAQNRIRAGGRQLDSNGYVAAQSPSGANSVNVAEVWTGVFDTPNATVSVIENDITHATSTFHTPGNFSATNSVATVIGSQGQGTQEFWQGLVAEVLIYDRVLTVDERNKVKSYIQDKFNITTANYDPAWAGQAPVTNDHTGSAGVSGSGTTTAAGVPSFEKSQSFSGFGSLETGSLLTVASAAALTGSGTTFAQTQSESAAAASFSGSGGMTTGRELSVAVTSLFTGSGSASVGSIPKPATSVNTSGSGTFAVQRVARIIQNAGFDGSGSLTGGVLSLHKVRVTDINYDGNEFISTSFTGAAGFSGVGSASAGANTTAKIRVTDIDYDGQPYEPIVTNVNVSLTGSGSMVASDPFDIYTDKYPGSDIQRSTSFTGSGSLAVNNRFPLMIRNIAFTGSGTVAESIVAKAKASVFLISEGNVFTSTVADTTGRAAVSLSGSGSMSTGASPYSTRPANFYGAGALTRTQAGGFVRLVALTGTGTLTRLGAAGQQRLAELFGEGGATSGVPRVGIVRVVNTSGSGSLVVNAFVPLSEFTYWNGTEEIALSLEGIWSGTQIVSLSLEQVS